jgi:DNA polymerase III epsilon subunit-like protein
MNINDVFKYKYSNTVNNEYPNTVNNEYHQNIINKLQEVIEGTNNTIILDTETDGKNKIVQISYYILNESNDITHSYDFFLNDGTHTLDFFRKFNTEFIKSNGIDVQFVLRKLADDFKHCLRIVCHNTQFDLGKLKLYFEKFSIDYTFPCEVFCTMTQSRDIVKALGKNGQIKNPKLGELCQFFGVEYNSDEAHDGLYDVNVTYQCYKMII